MRLGGLWDSAQHDNPSTCLDISGGGGAVSKLVDVPDASAHLPVLPTPPPPRCGTWARFHRGSVLHCAHLSGRRCTFASTIPGGGGRGGGEAEELRDFIHELQTSEKPPESELQQLCWIRSSDTTGERGVRVGVWALSSFYSSFHVTCCSSAD